MKTRLALTSIAVATLMVACAKPPQAEVDTAKQNLETAKGAQAEQYAAAELAEAQQAVAAVDAEIANQATKLAFLRKYDTTQQLIVEANTKAEAARQAAIDGKAAAKAAAEAAVEETNNAIAAAQEALASLDACPRKPKDFASQLELLSGSLAGLQAQVGELSAQVANEDFGGATEGAAALNGEIAVYQADLVNAKAKLKC